MCNVQRILCMPIYGPSLGFADLSWMVFSSVSLQIHLVGLFLPNPDLISPLDTDFALLLQTPLFLLLQAERRYFPPGNMATRRGITYFPSFLLSCWRSTSRYQLFNVFGLKAWHLAMRGVYNLTNDHWPQRWEILGNVYSKGMTSSKSRELKY